MFFEFEDSDEYTMNFDQIIENLDKENLIDFNENENNNYYQFESNANQLLEKPSFSSHFEEFVYPDLHEYQIKHDFHTQKVNESLLENRFKRKFETAFENSRQNFKDNLYPLNTFDCFVQDHVDESKKRKIIERQIEQSLSEQSFFKNESYEAIVPKCSNSQIMYFKKPEEIKLNSENFRFLASLNDYSQNSNDKFDEFTPNIDKSSVKNTFYSSENLNPTQSNLENYTPMFNLDNYKLKINSSNHYSARFKLNSYLYGNDQRENITSTISIHSPSYHSYYDQSYDIDNSSRIVPPCLDRIENYSNKIDENKLGNINNSQIIALKKIREDSDINFFLTLIVSIKM